MKKLFVVVLVLMMVAVLIVGCGKDTSLASDQQKNNDEQEAAKTSNEAETAEIEIWYYWVSETHQAALNKVITEYNTLGKGIVTAKYVPFADFKKQLSIGASAAQLPDIVIIDSPDHASYASMGIFADLTDRVDVSAYYEGPVASATLDGRLYGVPFGSNCLSLYYNTEMLEEAGVNPPTTWDELKLAAKKMTRENVTGIAFCSLQNEEGTFNFMPWLWSTGASSFEIGTENGMKALDFVQELVLDGSMSKEVINWTQGDVMNQFISGNVAMMINGPWQVATIQEQAPDLKWDVSLIPKDKEYASVLGGENFAIVAGKNEESALLFLDYITQPENISYILNEMGYIAAREDIADKQFTDDPIMKKFVEQMQYAHPRGPHAEWPSISDALSLALNEVITGSNSSQDAAKKAQDTINSIVG